NPILGAKVHSTVVVPIQVEISERSPFVVAVVAVNSFVESVDLAKKMFGEGSSSKSPSKTARRSCDADEADIAAAAHIEASQIQAETAATAAASECYLAFADRPPRTRYSVLIGKVPHP
ncbi:hypothetical protein LINGRAHAP2_LOCUS7447, partial [Linum grandiflorum]